MSRRSVATSRHPGCRAARPRRRRSQGASGTSDFRLRVMRVLADHPGDGSIYLALGFSRARAIALRIALEARYIYT